MAEKMNGGVDRAKGEQMSPEQSILERLYALERENRMMKRIGLIVIVIAASLLLTAQAPGKRTIEGNEFILRDSKGMVRSKWFMTPEGAKFSLLDPNGKERITVGFSTRLNEPLIELLSPTGPTGGSLTIGGSNGFETGIPHITLFQPKTTRSIGGRPETDPAKHLFIFPSTLSMQSMNDDGRGSAFSVDTLVDGGDGAPTVMLTMDAESTIFSMGDMQGSAIKLGSRTLRTVQAGKTQRISRASMIFQDQEKQIIWQAP